MYRGRHRLYFTRPVITGNDVGNPAHDDDQTESVAVHHPYLVSGDAPGKDEDQGDRHGQEPAAGQTGIGGSRRLSKP